MKKHSFYYYEDAREMAQIIINTDGGRMVEGSTDVRASWTAGAGK